MLTAAACGVLGLAVVLGVGAWAFAPVSGPGATSISAPAPERRHLAEVANLRVLFGHQSVGANVFDGVQSLYRSSEVPAPATPTARGSALDGERYLAHALVGVNGDPLGKLDAFARLVDGPAGNRLQVAVVELCFTDITASTDVNAVFAAYESTMSALEERHPGIRFVYATVPLSTDRGWKANLKAFLGIDDHMGPADNAARQRYNELVRERYGASGRLFDIAAVEATMDAGPTVRQRDGQRYYVLNPRFAVDNGHLNVLGSRAAAAEFLRVLATTASSP